MVVDIRWLFSIFCLLVLVYRTTVHGQTHQCVDRYIWLYDGSVNCSALEQDSVYRLNEDPVRWCNYVLTDCCETCRRILTQYTTTEPQQMTSSSPQSTTNHQQTTSTPRNDDDDDDDDDRRGRRRFQRQ